jgi:CarD family transcriptional regulator
MYQEKDIVIYGCEGIFEVVDVGYPDIPGVPEDKLYYTLTPVFGNGRIMTPIDTDVCMRRPVTKTEAMELISLIPQIQVEIEEFQNFKMLSEHYQKTLESHECADLLQLIKTIYTKREIAEESGKKLGMTDERYLKRAKELLHAEFSIVFGIPKEEVEDFIQDALASQEEPVYSTGRE